jgi:acyl-CoA thioester hydrolase
MDLNIFKFKFPLQLRWKDMDPLGHVNNAVFITYLETARSRFMLEACPGWDWHKHMFLIGNVNVDFKNELLLTAENAQVLVRTSKIGTKSFVLEYAIVSEKNGETVLHASGTTTQIMFDMKTRRTVEVADWVRVSLNAFEN